MLILRRQLRLFHAVIHRSRIFHRDISRKISSQTHSNSHIRATNNESTTTDPLADLNTSTLGTFMPEVTLPNGEKLQTGTVGALLINISKYDEAMTKLKAVGEDKVSKDSLRAEASKYERMLMDPLPLLKKVGLFDLFKPEEWVRDGGPGRKFVGRAAAERGY